MKYRPLFLLAFIMIRSLLGGSTDASGPEQTEQTCFQTAPEQLNHLVEAERRTATPGLPVPSFVTRIPSDHFAGVSAPCTSLAEARKSAVNDVVRQVLAAMNVRYEHRYVDRVFGNVRGPGPQRTLDDQLTGDACGIVLGVERGIVKSSWHRDSSDRYICFVLVHYPEETIREMRRLSQGAKLIVSKISGDGGPAGFGVRISEVHGVSVVLSSAQVTVLKHNRFAKAISFFVWHVPEGATHSAPAALEAVRLCGDSAEVHLFVQDCSKGLLDYLLGAEIDRILLLKGHDEIGRPVSAEAAF
ncbi:hypothetical protein ACFL0Q_01995 [Thermodesulfobacteriota bacterium]